MLSTDINMSISSKLFSSVLNASSTNFLQFPYWMVFSFYFLQWVFIFKAVSTILWKSYIPGSEAEVSEKTTETMCEKKNIYTHTHTHTPTIPYINSETNPPSPIISVVCKYLTSIRDSVLAQASVLLLFQYAATLSRGKGSDLFLQSGPFQNFHKFFQELTWSQ